MKSKTIIMAALILSILVLPGCSNKTQPQLDHSICWNNTKLAAEKKICEDAGMEARLIDFVFLGNCHRIYCEPK
jgi:uncharacterized lipoprotein NlpE involved in copper resistance